MELGPYDRPHGGLVTGTDLSWGSSISNLKDCLPFRRRHSDNREIIPNIITESTSRCEKGSLFFTEMRMALNRPLLRSAIALYPGLIW
jgi:hypothetical protein